MKRKDETKNKNLLLSANSGIKVGLSSANNFFAGSPLCKIDVFEKELVLSINHLDNFIVRFLWTNYYQVYGIFQLKEIPREIRLSYKDIKSYNWKEKVLGIFLKNRIVLMHQNKRYPPFLELWLNNKNAKKLISYLKVQHIQEKEIEKKLIGNNAISILLFILSGILVFILIKLGLSALYIIITFFGLGILYLIIKKIKREIKLNK